MWYGKNNKELDVPAETTIINSGISCILRITAIYSSAYQDKERSFLVYFYRSYACPFLACPFPLPRLVVSIHVSRRCLRRSSFPRGCNCSLRRALIGRRLQSCLRPGPVDPDGLPMSFFTCHATLLMYYHLLPHSMSYDWTMVISS